MKFVNIVTCQLIFAFLIVGSGAYAKKKSKKTLFYKGQINAQIGTSFISNILLTKPNYTYFGDVKKSFSIPIEARVDYGITDNIGGGIFISMAPTKVTI